MPFNPEILLERARLKAKLRRWRLFAIVLLVVFGAMFAGGGNIESAGFGEDYIALIEIKGMIDIDREATEAIAEIADNKYIKAVLVSVDSPGGTAVGGEVFYDALAKLKQKKPVVALFNNMATSAAYLIATPADRIFAHKATITGSIGALVQFPNVKGLTEKVGVTMNTVKTGELKGEPTPFTEMSEASRQMLQGMVDDFQVVFIATIAKDRNMSLEDVQVLADGRVFTGQQAIRNKLVDAIGGEEDAVKWLEENRKLAKGLEVFKVELKKPETDLRKLLKTLGSGTDMVSKALSFTGLLSIWPNSAM